MAPRILVVGAPRSGTTWVASVLSADPGTRLVHEPDNHRLWPTAVVGKVELGRQPLIDQVASPPDYWEIWQAASAGIDNEARPGWYLRKAALRAAGKAAVDRLLSGSRTPRDEAAFRLLSMAPRPRLPRDPAPVVVKSVHAAFAVEAVSTLFDAVVAVRRDPRNAVASWLELGWEVPHYEDDPGIRSRILVPERLVAPRHGDRVTDIAWAYGLLDHGLARATRRHPEWMVVDHEDLCDDPVPRFRRIFEHCGLEWTAAAAAGLLGSDGDGDGYETVRRRAEQRDRWRSRLDDAQVDAVERTTAIFTAAAPR